MSFVVGSLLYQRAGSQNGEIFQVGHHPLLEQVDSTRHKMMFKLLSEFPFHTHWLVQVGSSSAYLSLEPCSKIKVIWHIGSVQPLALFSFSYFRKLHYFVNCGIVSVTKCVLCNFGLLLPPFPNPHLYFVLSIVHLFALKQTMLLPLAGHPATAFQFLFWAFCFLQLKFKKTKNPISSERKGGTVRSL